jgi:uncharacterized membrane protein
MTSDKPSGRTTGLVFNAWNLLLLIPFIVLLTPIYNRESPELFGMPFFYWFQFAVILAGVSCTLIVYRMTSKAPVTRAPGTATDVDSLDEGSAE